MVLLQRYNQSWNAWLWSLFLVLIINPLSILTIGFWLSFSAVAAIIYVSSGRVRQNLSFFSKFWRMQFTVTLALLPFGLLFFQQFSYATWLANLIAMPGVCLVVVPFSLFGALFLLISNNLGSWVLLLSAKLLQVIWWWLTFLSHFLNSSWHHSISNWWILIATIIGVVILLAPRGIPGRYLGLLWLAPLVFYEYPHPKSDGECWFTLLDVGQGLSAVVQTKNHVLLYDTGIKFTESDSGSSVIIPFLLNRGINTIDTMVVSHGDSDHSGGARSILEKFPVTNILTSVPNNFVAHHAQSCFMGQEWQWDGVDFRVLSPPKNSFLVGNNASCVLQVTNGTDAILLPGDIERSAEDLLVNNYGGKLKSTVLVAPHHGSNTSSAIDLVDQIRPQYVVFPVGYKNRFHFPHKKVTARYMKNNAILLNTSQSGAITFKFGDKPDILQPDLYRENKKRFWYDNPYDYYKASYL